MVRLGVDETVSRRHHRFVTHLVDLDSGTVIATIEGCSTAALLQALAAPRLSRAGRVEQVANRPVHALRQNHPPPAAPGRRQVPCAPLFARAVDQVRRRAVRQTEGRRGRKIDLLWRSRMVLLKRFERLTDRQEQRLFDALDGEDHHGEVGPPTSPTKKPSSCSTGPAPPGCGRRSASCSATHLAHPRRARATDPGPQPRPARRDRCLLRDGAPKVRVRINVILLQVRSEPGEVEHFVDAHASIVTADRSTRLLGDGS